MKLERLLSCFCCSTSLDNDLSTCNRATENQSSANHTNASTLAVSIKGQTSNIHELPDELLLSIFEFLPTPKDFAAVTLTQNHWFQILKNSSLKTATCFYLYQMLSKNFPLPSTTITCNDWQANHNQLQRKIHPAYYYNISTLEDSTTSLQTFHIQKKSLFNKQIAPHSQKIICVFKDEVTTLSIERFRTDAYPNTEERTVGLSLVSELTHLPFFEQAAIQSVLTFLNRNIQANIQKEDQKMTQSRIVKN